MRTGIIFDIKEFAVHDGPGIRTTVFLKGCPLCCTWCHNPEGLCPFPEIIRSGAGKRQAGKEYTSTELARILNSQADILRADEGGVTFSGGEPLMQFDFVLEVIEQLNRLHVVLDTSGYASENTFKQVVSKCDLIYFDLKIMDAEQHRRYTLVDNKPILQNLRNLSGLDVPVVIRVPLVPGVTDSDENLLSISKAISGMPNLIRVDLLLYNRAAGGKYKAVGRDFSPNFDELAQPNINESVFANKGIEVSVL